MPKLALVGGPKLRTRPFHRWPHWDERERSALLEVLEAGSWGGFPSPNRYAARFAAAFAQHTGTGFGVCCANGSVAIELALQAAGIGPGDEVLVPAYTFVATATSVAFAGADPVLVDVLPDTYCIDPRQATNAITPRTRAIIPVHLACNMADMDALLALAARHGLVVIEDCAHAHGHRWKGKAAGALGDLGTFSFQTTKLLTAGEGGIVVTSGEERAMRLHSLVNCGRKEPGHDAFAGRMLGKNYRISEWQAAVLEVQLARLEEQTLRREARAAQLERALAGVPGLSFTRRDPRNDQRAIYQLIVKYDAAAWQDVPRDRVVDALRAEGVPCSGRFYVPLYDDPLLAMDPKTNPLCARGFDPKRFHCPVAAKAAYEEAIWLPHPLLLGDERDVDDVAAAFVKVHEHRDEMRRGGG